MIIEKFGFNNLNIENKCLLTTGENIHKKINELDREDIYEIYFLIIPLPFEIKNKPIEISTYSYRIFTKYFNQKYDDVDFVIRTYFILSSKFKSKISQTNKYSNIIFKYSILNLPKYVWVSEISFLYNKNPEKYFNDNYYEENNKIVRKPIGRIIYDTTVPDYEIYPLAMDFSNEFFSGKEIMNFK